MALSVRLKPVYRMSISFPFGNLDSKGCYHGQIFDAQGKAIGRWTHPGPDQGDVPVLMEFDEAPPVSAHWGTPLPSQNPPEEPPPAKSWRDLPAQF
jgi:hypothetical protein